MVGKRKLFVTDSFPPQRGGWRDFGFAGHKPSRPHQFGTKLHVYRSHHFSYKQVCETTSDWLISKSKHLNLVRVFLFLTYDVNAHEQYTNYF